MSATLAKMCILYSSIVLTLFITVILFIEDWQKSIAERSLPFKLNDFWVRFRIGTDKQSLKQLDKLFPNSALFRTYNQLLQANRNLETTFECIGSPYNQSCLYKNLYYTDKNFWILTSKKILFPLPDVRIGAFILSEFNPSWRPFYSYADLDEFVRQRINPIVIPDLTLYFDIPWLSNIGHALFDGLYPAYVALIRFPPKHLEPFRILLSTVSEINDHSHTEDVYNIFAGLGTMNVTVLEEMSVGKWFAFQELVVGSGNMCQRCLQPNLQLPGGIELNGSRLFRDRMYKQYRLTPPAARKNHSAERRNLQKPLRAYIIDNKRFTIQDRMEINAAIDEINMCTDAYINQATTNRTKLHWPLVHVSYINYSHITLRNDDSIQLNTPKIKSSALPNHSRMVTHLLLLQDIDIYVTGPGTGQMYQTFLSDGSVNINLGGLGYIKQNNTFKKYTSFLEQYMTSGTPYIKGLYYPINERPKGIERETVITLIRNAARLIMNGFSIPVNPRDNLASDGQLFIEMCELDKDFCMTVTDRSRKNDILCIDTWPEEIIHENGPWSSNNVTDIERNVTCSYNRTLLLQLKKKYNINSHV